MACISVGVCVWVWYVWWYVWQCVWYVCVVCGWVWCVVGDNMSVHTNHGRPSKPLPLHTDPTGSPLALTQPTDWSWSQPEGGDNTLTTMITIITVITACDHNVHTRSSQHLVSFPVHSHEWEWDTSLTIIVGLLSGTSPVCTDICDRKTNVQIWETQGQLPSYLTVARC